MSIKCLLYMFARACTICFCIRVCSAGSNDRAGPLGMKGMFGTRNQYPGGSIGIEWETEILLRDRGSADFRDGVAYATAIGKDGRNMWMVQVDAKWRDARIMELVSHVIDASDTSSLLTLERSMMMFLNQFTERRKLVPLRTLVDQYNDAVDRVNQDPSWDVMDLPMLAMTESARHFEVYTVGVRLHPQVNFGFRVERYSHMFIGDFLGGFRKKYRHFNDYHLQYQSDILKASSLARRWMEKFCAMKMAPQASTTEEGILTLLVAKTMHKIAFFGFENYKSLTKYKSYILAMLPAATRVRFKNSMAFLPKVNLRELISIMPAKGALRLFLEDTAFLKKLGAESNECIVVDILRLVDRYKNRGTRRPVDDDCFGDSSRAFSYQYYDHRIAIVMETRFPIEPSAIKKIGGLRELQSSLEAVDILQDMYGDLRGSSDSLPYQKFEVANAIMRLPEYNRVDFRFDGVCEDIIQKYVLPLARDTRFLRSLRHIAGIYRIDFTSHSAAFRTYNHVLYANIDWIDSLYAKIGGIRLPADFFQTWLKSFLNRDFQLALTAAFARMRKKLLQYGLERPEEVRNSALRFDTAVNFRAKAIEKLARMIMASNQESKNLIGDVFGSNYEKSGFVFDDSATPVEEDVRHTLEMLMDSDFDVTALRLYHRHDNVLMKKFSFLNGLLESSVDTCRPQWLLFGKGRA